MAPKTARSMEIESVGGNDLRFQTQRGLRSNLWSNESGKIYSSDRKIKTQLRLRRAMQLILAFSGTRNLIKKRNGGTMSMQLTTHRASLQTIDNEFLIEQPDGDLHDTCTGQTVVFDCAFRKYLPEIAAEIDYHRLHGFSPNCVICHDDAVISQAYPMEARRDTILAALESSECENEDELILELAELQRAIESGDDPRTRAQILIDAKVDDWADGRSMLLGGNL